MFDVKAIRRDFPMFQNNPELIYFDSAATSFKPQKVIDAVMNYYCNKTVNIHRGDYDLSFNVSNTYEEAREVARKFINAQSSDEIVFTNGASSALNLVAYGYGQKYLTADDVILSSEAEHASNILPWFRVAEVTGAKIEYIPLRPDGSFDIELFKKAMHPGVKVVTLAQVSNVLGYILPMKEIAKIAHSYGAIVVCDGAQSVPHIKTDVQDTDIDFLAFSGHKMCGPSGVGVLYGKYALLDKMDAFMLGGGSNARFDICGNILLKKPPFKFEAGTPCIEGVLGLKAAMEYLMDIGMENVEANDKMLVHYLSSKLLELPNIELYNPHSDCAICTFNVKGVFAQDAATYLNTKHIAVRSGNHCAKILLNVIGASETIRASMYLYNTKEEIDRFVKEVAQIDLDKCVGVFL